VVGRRTGGRWSSRRSATRGRLLRTGALLLPFVSAVGMVASATQAHADPAASTISSFYGDSEAGDAIGGGGGSSPLPAGTDVVTYAGSDDGYPVFESGATQFAFAAPAGERLEVGTYEDADTSVDVTSGKLELPNQGVPGLFLQGGPFSRPATCDTQEGRFIVDEVTYDAGGNVTSFAARFEDHCQSTPSSAFFGDIAYNSTAAFWSRSVSPNSLDFTTDPTQTITITNGGPSPDTPQGFSFTGPSAAEFAVTASTCTGTLVAGAACQVVVTFTPNSADSRPSADLVFNDSLAPLGSPGEPDGAGEGRSIPLTATLSRIATVSTVVTSPTAIGTTSTSPAPQVSLGQPITLMVQLQGNAGGGSPTGSVNFTWCDVNLNASPYRCEDTYTFAPVPMDPGPADSSQAISTPFVPNDVGGWCINGTYSGDTYYDNADPGNSVFGDCVDVVQPASTEYQTSMSLAVTNPTVLSGSEHDTIFTVTLSAPGAPFIPPGLVGVYDGSGQICAMQFAGSIAGNSFQEFCNPGAAQLAPGSYNDLYAEFWPEMTSSETNDPFYAGSTSAPQSMTVETLTTTPPPTTPPTTTPPPSTTPPTTTPPATGAPESGSAASDSGYDLVGQDGGVFVFPTGHSGGYYGSLPGLGVKVDDIVGMVPSTDDDGYFLVGRDGGVFAFGYAPFEGSLPGLGVKVDDVAGMVPTASDDGYFLVGQDGGVFAFGDAPYLGSLPGEGIHVDDVIGIAATPSGGGYWVVTAGGTVYPFGDAGSFGSATDAPSPVAAITATPDGGGYWIVTQAGGVYPFGDAGNFGSLPALGVTPAHPVIGLVPTAGDEGYWLIGSDGGIFAFGDAPFVGSLPGLGVKVTDVVGAVPTLLGGS